MFNFDFGDLKDLTALKDMGPSIRDAVKEARVKLCRRARKHGVKLWRRARKRGAKPCARAGRHGAKRMRAAEEARRAAARQFHVFSSDNGAVKSTTIDLGKAQITVTDPQGEMRIEKVNGKKMLTAKDPQGRLLFSGPIDSKEELDKVPAEVRQRYDKLEQKDLPGVISTASTDTEDADDDSDDADDADAIPMTMTITTANLRKRRCNKSRIELFRAFSARLTCLPI